MHGAITAPAPVDSVGRYTDPGATVLQGTARFVAWDALAVAIGAETRRINARRIVIATGSRPAVPDLPGLDQVPFLRGDTLFDLAEAPEHLLVLGGVSSGWRWRRRTPGSAAASPSCSRAPSSGRGTTRSWWTAFAPRDTDVDLGLRSRTNRFVYAAGDVADPQGVGPRYFTHVGSYHAGTIVRRALFRAPARLDYAALPRVTYTSPELAKLGLTEAEARAAGHAVETLRWPLAENDRAVAEGDTAGLVKLVVSGSRVLGAGILAPHAGEMIGA